jgi:hypothetical protein
MSSAIATVNLEYDKLADLVRNLGSSSSTSFSSSSSSSSSTSSSSALTQQQLLQLQQENTRLKQENRSLRRRVQEYNSNSSNNSSIDTESNLREQISQLSSTLASERAQNNHLNPNNNNNNNPNNNNPNHHHHHQVQQLRAQIAQLETRNSRDHQKMRTLRHELLSQSTEADRLVEQNDSFLRQSNLSNLGSTLGLQASQRFNKSQAYGTASTKTEGRLEMLAREFSELERGGEDLMLSSITSSQDESALYHTALPFDRPEEKNNTHHASRRGRRKSMNVNLGNGSHVTTHRNGSVDMHIGSGTQVNNGNGSSGGDDLGVDELQ